MIARGSLGLASVRRRPAAARGPRRPVASGSPESWDQARGLGLIGAVCVTEHAIQCGFLDADAPHQRRQRERETRDERQPVAEREAEPGEDQQQTGVGRVPDPRVRTAGNHSLPGIDLDGGPECAAERRDRPYAHGEPEPHHADPDNLQRHGHAQRRRQGRCNECRSDGRTERDSNQNARATVLTAPALALHALAHAQAHFEQSSAREGEAGRWGTLRPRLRPPRDRETRAVARLEAVAETPLPDTRRPLVFSYATSLHATTASRV